MKSVSDRYRPGDRLTLEIERIVSGGAGLARGPFGVVLVELAAPGDRVRVEIDSLRRGAAHGRIVELIEAGAGRIDPPCRYYGTCGGCDFQHLTYETQLAAKEQIVLDALGRIAGVTVTPQIEHFPAPHPFGSRARVTLHTEREHGEIGFFERRSNKVVDIEQCIVSREEIDFGLNTIRRSRQPLPPSIRLLAGPGIVRSEPELPPIEGGGFWLTIAGIDYLVDAASFFQSSLDLLPELIDYVVATTGPNRELAWDFFSGAGLFSLPLARIFDRVTGVDSDPRASANAIRSAARNGISNAGFAIGDVEGWLSGRERASIRPDFIVVDPPRSGLGQTLAKMLMLRRPQRLTYVSCDPGTLARDLKILTSGDLQLSGIALFDLFPQNHHVETVVQLVAAG